MKAHKIVKKLRTFNFIGRITVEIDDTVTADINTPIITNMQMIEISKKFPVENFDAYLTPGDGVMSLSITKNF